MRRQDKYKNIEQANLLLENSYLKSRGLLKDPFDKTKRHFLEMSQQSANITNLAALGADEEGWTTEDLTFPFKSRSASTGDGILIHDVITIDVFNAVGKENIQFQEYHLIFGESSMAIFDVFGVNETAGLNRVDCQAHLDKLAVEGKNETWNGAYIAGLTNWSGNKLYCFYNVGRMLYGGGVFANRILPHESLHLTRNLITIEANEYIRSNQGKDKWWEDDRAIWTDMKDENEEYFAETLERLNTIAYSRWDKAKGMMEIPPKPKTTTPPTTGNVSRIDITKTPHQK